MRKTFILALLAVVALCAVAFAEETSGATYTSPNGEVPQGFIDYINEQECIDHTHQYQQNDPDYELGVGVDLVVYEADPKRTGAKKLIPDNVEVQNKYDFSNENGSTYVVAQYNIWDLFAKKKAE